MAWRGLLAEERAELDEGRACICNHDDKDSGPGLVLFFESTLGPPRSENCELMSVPN